MQEALQGKLESVAIFNFAITHAGSHLSKTMVLDFDTS